MNDLIDKMIGYLKSLKTESETSRLFQFQVKSGKCTLTVEYQTGTGRISLISRDGDVILDFERRKLATVTDIAGCLMKAVHNATELDKGKPIIVSSMQ